MRNMKFSPLVAMIIIFLVGVLAGFATGWSAKGADTAKKVMKASEEAYRSAMNIAENKMKEAEPYLKNVNSLSGTVVKVEGNKITFFTNKLVHALQDEGLKTRVAIVGSDTVISVYDLAEEKREEKDINNEINGLRKQRTELEQSLKGCSFELGTCPPEIGPKMDVIDDRIKELESELSGYSFSKEASTSDIRPGYGITVSAGKDVNIADMEEFEVVNITAKAPDKEE